MLCKVVKAISVTLIRANHHVWGGFVLYLQRLQIEVAIRLELRSESWNGLGIVHYECYDLEGCSL